MPPKVSKMDINKKTQPTLSKFFPTTSQGEKGGKNSCKDNRYLHTDEADDFQMATKKLQRKRLKTSDDSVEVEPSVKECQVEFESKRQKVQEKSVDRLSELAPGPSKSSTRFNSNFWPATNRLERFAYEDSVSAEKSFKDRDNPQADSLKVRKEKLEDWAENIHHKVDNQSHDSVDNQSNIIDLTKGEPELSVGEKKLPCHSLKLTPLEQQYVEIKECHPDAVLFVECGYKYRFFGDDAKRASEVLKIFCHKDHNFMTASIPNHRLFVHVRRMVVAGYKVGVVKQTETTHLKACGSNKVGPFSRRLTAIYTRSTLIGRDLNSLTGASEDETDSDINSNLMCVYEQPCDIKGKQDVGIVCVDPGTSVVVYDNFLDGSTLIELETRLTHLAPVEILISSQASDSLKTMVNTFASLSPRDNERIRVEKFPAAEFLHPKAFNTISQFFKADPGSLQTVLSLAKPVVSCLAALSVYLKEFELENVLALTNNFEPFSEKNRFMHLSGKSLTNLEIFHNSCDGTEKGSLFWFLNNTLSKFGSRMLRSWLSHPLIDVSDIQARQEAVEAIVRGELNGQEKFRELLNKAPDLERGLCSIFHGKSSPLEFLSVTKTLDSIRKELSGNQQRVTSPLLQTLLQNIPEYLSDIGTFTCQISQEGARSKDSSQLFVDDSVFPAVAERKQDIEQVENSIQGHRKDVRLTLKQPGLTYVTVLQTEFLIEVKNTQLTLVPKDWIQISSTKTVSRFHTPFIVQQYRKLNELREQLMLDVNTAWTKFLQQFSLGFGRYKKAVSSLATLDCLMSLAQTASLEKYCRPQILSTLPHIKIEKGRHPVMEVLHDGQDQVVPNDTNLGADWPRAMLLTGPNMGGKSSYVRQVALMSILTQIGSFLPAESACMGILDAIYTRMGASDEIFKGRSTFMVELQETAVIMNEATERSLVILDELGRGTSTHDGVAIAHATLDHFVTKCPCLLLFVTHFPTLSCWSKRETVCNKHMAFIVNQQMEEMKTSENITFLYELTEGAAERSYGLNVARIAQLPFDILERAAVKSQEFEKKMQEKKRGREMFVKLFKAGQPQIESAVNFYLNFLHCPH